MTNFKTLPLQLLLVMLIKTKMLTLLQTPTEGLLRMEATVINSKLKQLNFISTLITSIIKKLLVRLAEIRRNIKSIIKAIINN